MNSAQNFTDAGTMLASFMSNPNSRGRVSIAGQAASKAAAGAQMGMAAGPWGAAAGAAIGGIAGIITGSADKKREENLAAQGAQLQLQNAQAQGSAYASQNPEEIYGRKYGSYFRTGGRLRMYAEGGRLPSESTGVSKKVLPMSSKNITDNIIARDKQKQRDNYYLSSPTKKDSNLENILEVVDPTGISSWDDVYRSAKNTGITSKETALEVLGALPLLNKVGKVGKALKDVSSGLKLTGKQARNLKAIEAGSLAVSKVGPAAGRLSDVYQAVNEWKTGGRLNEFTGNGKQLNSTTTELVGPSHEQGGVDLGNGNEAEGGETVTQQRDGTYVMTNLLGIADAHKKISKQIGKIENKAMTPERVNSLRFLRNKEQKLINLQQTLNGNK